MNDVSLNPATLAKGTATAGATRGPSSALAAALAEARFVVTAEVSPPVASEATATIEKALPLKGVATAVNVTDGAGAKAHLSSLATAVLLQRHGIEPVLQMTCRDRNRLALQGDLLGAVALGLRNVLLLNGDDPKSGDQPETKGVFDVDTRGLIGMAYLMREQRKLPSGTSIAGEVPLFIGAADMPIDPPAGWEPKGLAAKIAAGADFAQTQFCMDVGIARRYAERLLEAGIAQRFPILVGVAPIPSARSARWMREKLYGTQIPDAIVERLERAADPKAEGKRICIEVLQQLAAIPGIAGAHVMAPQFMSAVPEVIRESGVNGALRARV